jgi:hypothetical protein
MQHDISRRRQTFVSLVLALVGLVFFSAVLIFLTAGFFTYGGTVVLGVLLLGCFHWVLWGRTLSRQVAGEREEEQLRRRALGEPLEEEHPTPAEPPGPNPGIKLGPSQRFRRL